MDNFEFVKSVYLGDRACKRIELDGWEKEVRVYIDVISRVRSAVKEWDYYTEEDIVDGAIVFSGVLSFDLGGSGPLCNDYVNSFECIEESVDGSVMFELSIDAVGLVAGQIERILRVRCTNVHLLDPKNPELKITWQQTRPRLTKR
jgi:hypothetical protein